jgi:hypothetical protein
MRVQVATSLAGTVPKAAWEDSTPGPFPEWSSLQVASRSRATTAPSSQFHVGSPRAAVRAGDRTVIQRFPSPQWHFLCSQLSLLHAGEHDSKSSTSSLEMDLGVLGEVDRRAIASYPIAGGGVVRGIVGYPVVGAGGEVIGKAQMNEATLYPVGSKTQLTVEHMQTDW